MKVLVFIAGVFLLYLLFLVQNAFSKPVYNKMSNVWEDDPIGRKFHNSIIIAMVIIAFMIGLYM